MAVAELHLLPPTLDRIELPEEERAAISLTLPSRQQVRDLLHTWQGSLHTRAAPTEALPPLTTSGFHFCCQIMMVHFQKMNGIACRYHAYCPQVQSVCFHTSCQLSKLKLGTRHSNRWTAQSNSRHCVSDTKIHH
nr:hypothetical protein Iba_scaffold14176CG0010 [Ipomoea batatas]